MSRTSKKILYGALYLVILFLLFRGVYYFIFPPNSQCVECAGVCADCPASHTTNYEPLRVEGTVAVFTSVKGRVVLLAKVLNPNALYAARNTSYVFHVWDREGQLLRDVKGETTIDASSEIYLFETVETTHTPATIGAATLELGDSAWSVLGEISKPTISLPLNIKTFKNGDVITVEGMIKNQGLIDAPDVEIIVLLHDRSEFHDLLFAGKTSVSIPSMSDSAFSMLFPRDKGLADAVDVGRTEVVRSIQ